MDAFVCNEAVHKQFAKSQFEIAMKKMHSWQNGRRSIIFVDHDIDRVLELSSRVMVLDQHSIVLDEPASFPDLASKITELMN